MTVKIENIAKLKDFVGHEVAVSDWVKISQARINQFAEATGDDQWIHVDVERAKIESPFEQTVAHGFLTLALLSEFARTAMEIGGVRMGINYGLNRVRFVAPVFADSRTRGRFALAELEEIKGGAQAIWHVDIERETSEKFCCVAEWLVRYYV